MEGDQFEYDDLRGDLERAIIGFVRHHEHDELLDNLYRIVKDMLQFAYESGKDVTSPEHGN